ncbi:MAG TPA: hypothetical protein VLJ17_24655 [Xanthobacteraceae bacterium]|nr:hypothetical protein [Xanthobacteraceae bacterium]
MKTIIHTYWYNTANEHERQEYATLRDKLKAEGYRCFEALGEYDYRGKDLDNREITLETQHLFDNQWNTAPIEGVSEQGLRVFDWALSVYPDNRKVKAGYWLEQTAEMRDIRRNTVKCGYCGKQEPAAKGYVFCPHCIDSEYLKEDELYLTRLRPVDEGRKPVPPLTEAEKAHLLPLYREAQLHGSTARGKLRIAKERQEVESKFERKTRSAKIERDGMIWLMDRGFRVDNVIYYDHTEKFCFGWRGAMADSVKSALLDVLSEFPFDYEFKNR